VEMKGQDSDTIAQHVSRAALDGIGFSFSDELAARPKKLSSPPIMRKKVAAVSDVPGTLEPQHEKSRSMS